MDTEIEKNSPKQAQNCDYKSQIIENTEETSTNVWNYLFYFVVIIFLGVIMTLLILIIYSLATSSRRERNDILVGCLYGFLHCLKFILAALVILFSYCIYWLISYLVRLCCIYYKR